MILCISIVSYLDFISNFIWVFALFWGVGGGSIWFIEWMDGEKMMMMSSCQLKKRTLGYWSHPGTAEGPGPAFPVHGSPRALLSGLRASQRGRQAPSHSALPLISHAEWTVLLWCSEQAAGSSSRGDLTVHSLPHWCPRTIGILGRNSSNPRSQVTPRSLTHGTSSAISRSKADLLSGSQTCLLGAPCCICGFY